MRLMHTSLYFFYEYLPAQNLAPPCHQFVWGKEYHILGLAVSAKRVLEVPFDPHIEDFVDAEKRALSMAGHLRKKHVWQWPS